MIAGMPMPLSDFRALPPALGVAVSGGADSVALLRMLVEHARDTRLVVIHVNHQLRGEVADEDERFVGDLACRLGIDAFVRRRDELESTPNLPANPSARYRAMRLAAYGQAMAIHRLDGVALAHHADDQAETILLRLIRGGGWPALRGMSERSTVSGVPILRPLLGVRRESLRDYLRSISQPWREDASNASPTYRRNVIRTVLARRPELIDLLITLAQQAQTLQATLDAAAPAMPDSFARNALQQPAIVAGHLARRWLIDRGAPADDVSPSTCKRLIAQALDMTSPARQHYPGALWVRRRAGRVFVHEGETASLTPDLPYNA